MCKDLNEVVYPTWDKQYFGKDWLLKKAKLTWWVNIDYHEDGTKTVKRE